jgi:hypothetical protein
MKIIIDDRDRKCHLIDDNEKGHHFIFGTSRTDLNMNKASRKLEVLISRI